MVRGIVEIAPVATTDRARDLGWISKSIVGRRTESILGPQI